VSAPMHREAGRCRATSAKGGECVKISHDPERCECDDCKLTMWAYAATAAMLSNNGNELGRNLKKINEFLADKIGQSLE